MVEADAEIAEQQEHDVVRQLLLGVLQVDVGDHLCFSQLQEGLDVVAGGYSLACLSKPRGTFFNRLRRWL